MSVKDRAPRRGGRGPTVMGALHDAGSSYFETAPDRIKVVV